MDQNEIKTLLEKYKLGQCTEAEKNLIDRWYLEQFNKKNLDAYDEFYDPIEEENEIWSQINRQVKPKSRGRVLKFVLQYTSVAAILLVTFLGVKKLFFTQTETNTVKLASTNKQSDTIATGSNNAILTLGNGNQVVLNSKLHGKIAAQGNTSVNTIANGQIAYTQNEKDSISSHTIVYNTISTPRGGQYCIVLQDGTKAYLNASSSLTYPTSFIGNYRIVKLVGEAYFEVAHNKNMPFKVLCSNQTVQVLGTHFNIDNYPDEPYVKTTLIEGSVRVTKNNQSIILHPDQQSIVQNESKSSIIRIKNVDSYDAIAWKNGLFVFDGENIQEIMRKISRWYNVEIQFNGGISKDRFAGSVSRFTNINDVLNILELTNKVHFQIKGKTIKVSK